ncbi:MAG: response regulator transcription factor [Dinghuibacter sp.]|nr:response regulator transcription factor [Dinghuibacter sp.]
MTTMPIKTIRVAIFDDNHIVLDACKVLLNDTEGFLCTGAFLGCDNLVHDIEKSKPDVVLMDIEMYEVDGIEATRRLKDRYPEIKILIRTIFDDEYKILAALCAGANGYITKNISPVKMLEGITDVYNGGAVISANVAKKMFTLFQRYISPQVAQTDYQLTNREKEILQLMAKGKSLPKIAEEIFLSYETVRGYVKSIYRKLHVAGKTEAVAKALRERII